MVTGANEAQQQIPEFLTGRIHSIPNLERQQSNHNVSLDTTLPAPETVATETPQDPLNRLADVLVNLQNKPQTMTIRPVQTTPMTFDGKCEKFELFEDLFHTMIKMQPAMTEQMKINHFHSLLRKGAPQTFENINSINRQTLQARRRAGHIPGEICQTGIPGNGKTQMASVDLRPKYHEIAGFLGGAQPGRRKSIW